MNRILKKIKNVIYISVLNNILLVSVVSVFMIGCDSDDPVKEDVPELITQVRLTFTPNGGGAAIVASANDPDGQGIQPVQVDVPIVLNASTSYALSISLINDLANPSDPEYDISDEVLEEAEEHMFFFSWTNNVFADPVGNGNIDNRADPMNYDDDDSDGLPLGLTTSWTTAEVSSGNFRVVLKHQPDLKTASSDANTGETDLDITFPITIE